jgi:hypothetical protein
LFLSSRKYDPSCSSRIPDPNADFLPIPDPGSKGQKGTGSQIPANHPPPPEYLLTQDICKETSPPLLHTTTHNNTQQHYTTALGYIKLPMYLFWAQMALASLVPFQRPKKLPRFSGPTPSNALHNDVAPLKIIAYRPIKTTGILIVILSP